MNKNLLYDLLMILSFGVLLFVVSLTLSGCSSFGIRTSTQIPYIQMGDNSTLNLRMDGSIPGSGIESNIPIDKIVLEVITRIREQEEGPE